MKLDEWRELAKAWFLKMERADDEADAERAVRSFAATFAGYLAASEPTGRIVVDGNSRLENTFVGNGLLMAAIKAAKAFLRANHYPLPVNRELPLTTDMQLRREAEELARGVLAAARSGSEAPDGNG